MKRVGGVEGVGLVKRRGTGDSELTQVDTGAHTHPYMYDFQILPMHNCLRASCVEQTHRHVHAYRCVCTCGCRCFILP